jgi:hypothetical protein
MWLKAILNISLWINPYLTVWQVLYIIFTLKISSAKNNSLMPVQIGCEHLDFIQCTQAKTKGLIESVVDLNPDPDSLL